MYKKGSGNDKQGKDAGNRTRCPYRNFSQAIIFYTDYPILDKLFELCPIMQTAIPHESQADYFFLTHTQFPEIINFDITFALSEQPSHSEIF